MLYASLLAALPASVNAIATFSVGYDHVDVAAAHARSISVVNTPDVLSVATAECAMLLILAAARRAGEGERVIRAGNWDGWAPTQLMGTQVSGRRLGIFGFGRIGRELAKMARGFGMQIHYHDSPRMPPALQGAALFHAPARPFPPVVPSGTRAQIGAKPPVRMVSWKTKGVPLAPPWISPGGLVQKMPRLGEDHRHVVLVAEFDDLCVAVRAARLDDHRYPLG